MSEVPEGIKVFWFFFSKKNRPSFLKKRSKKLFPIWAGLLVGAGAPADVLDDWMTLVKMPGVWECRNPVGEACEAASRYFWITDARGWEYRVQRADNATVRDRLAFHVEAGRKCRDGGECVAFFYPERFRMAERSANGGVTALRFVHNEPPLAAPAKEQGD